MLRHLDGPIDELCGEDRTLLASVHGKASVDMITQPNSGSWYVEGCLDCGYGIDGRSLTAHPTI